MGTHEAAVGKHTCDYCGAEVSQCEDTDTNGKCDICGGNVEITQNPENPENPEKPEIPEVPDKPNDPNGSKGGLGTGAIVAIVIGSLLLVCVGGYSALWFVIGKKSFADLVTVFKTKNFSELALVFKQQKN